MTSQLDNAIKAIIGDKPLDMTELLSKYAEQLSQLEKRTETLERGLKGLVAPADLFADTEKFIIWLKKHRGIMETTENLEDLVGLEADFYGVDGNCFKLDDTVYEVIEDEEDGYRSSMDYVVIRSGDEACDKIFFGSPIARVVVEHEESDDDLYRLVDLHDGHEWLRFGTGEYQDWYPYFVFEYIPKPAPVAD